MSEPDYIAQTFEREHTRSAETCAAWWNARAEEAKAKGCSYARFTRDQMLLRHLGIDGMQDGLLFEAWVTRPDDRGEPRWQFTAAAA